MCRSVVSRLFQPEDRLVRARLQQMHVPDLLVPDPELGITGAEPNCSLYERDRLLEGAGVELALAESEEGVELALAESEEGVNIVAIVRNRRLAMQTCSTTISTVERR
jgi:hypothetical protein